MRLLVVDDNAPFREGLRSMLEAHGVEVAGLASSGPQGVILAGSLRPDGVLVGAHVPTGEKLEAIRQIRAEDPRVRILVYMAEEDDDDLFAAFAAGASGYLPGGVSQEALLEILSGVARGESTLSRGLCRRLLDAMTSSAEDGSAAPRLSPREGAILERLAQGCTYLEVAGALGISDSAVRYHLREVLRRLPGLGTGDATSQGRITLSPVHP